MIRENKRGFTLIELLAVIVILAVIALIATPLIMNTINDAKEGSAKNSASGYVKALEQTVGTQMVKDTTFKPDERQNIVGKVTGKSQKGMATGDLTETSVSHDVQYKGTKPTSLDFILKNGAVTQGSEITISGYTFVLDEKGEWIRGREFSYTGKAQKFVVPRTGTYQIELWGASGGNNTQGASNEFGIGGKGAYVRGDIKLKQGEILYIYVGENPEYNSTHCYTENPNDSFNCSKYGSCVGGGGATDIRLQNGEWYNSNGIKSRIMVAAGGGGGYYSGSGGNGGTLIGGSGEGGVNQTEIVSGGTQTAEGFGYGMYATTIGGGGYYGGNALTSSNAGGGSSFISGHTGCDAIKEDGTHTGQPNHYSGKIFENSKMIAGNQEMPNPKGGTMVGNLGHGHARILLKNT